MAELLAANQITIAKVLDGADGEMSAEQIAQLNQASEDASQAKTDVANLEIGGRNYAVKTDSFSSTKNGITIEYDEDSYHIYGTNTKTDSDYFLAMWNLIDNVLEPGTVYTVSTTEPLPSGVRLGINTQNSSGQEVVAASNSRWYGDGIKTSNTFTCRTDTNGKLIGYFAIEPTCGTVDVTFKIKLEKGNKSTDWTPAPEDVDAGIKDAAKTATNYIHSDTTNGLVVNNNQNVGVGYDVQLKADGSNTGMNIRQDGEILASFLQNQVSLGKNSINSKVAMCGDKGGVSASFGYCVDSVISNNAEMGSTLSFDFNETTFKNKVGQTTGFYEFTYTSAGGWTLFDPVNDTSYAVTLSQYGITMKTPTSSIKDHAGITINYVLDGSVKFYNADISNPVRKLELEMAENPSSSESDYANITIERQSGTYANGDGKEHSIITMITLHEFANVATLQLFDDEISLNATRLYLTSSNGDGAIQLDGNVYVNGGLLTGVETRTLLWTNARPTSNFAAQTVGLALSGYQFVEVIYRVSTSSTQQIIERCEIGAGIRAERFYNPTATNAILQNLYRGGNGASTNGYAFDDAYVKATNATGSTKNNSYMIPYKIYGIKEV